MSLVPHSVPSTWTVYPLAGVRAILFGMHRILARLRGRPSSRLTHLDLALGRYVMELKLSRGPVTAARAIAVRDSMRHFEG